VEVELVEHLQFRGLFKRMQVVAQVVATMLEVAAARVAAVLQAEVQALLVPAQLIPAVVVVVVVAQVPPLQIKPAKAADLVLLLFATGSNKDL
jgi:hypothetical protein